MNATSTQFDSFQFFLYSPPLFTTVIHCFVCSSHNLEYYQGKSLFSTPIESYLYTIHIIPYFWCTHYHTSSPSFIFLMVQSNTIGTSKLRLVVLFLLNLISLLFDPLCIFDALIFLLHHSRSFLFFISI